MMASAPALLPEDARSTSKRPLDGTPRRCTPFSPPYSGTELKDLSCKKAKVDHNAQRDENAGQSLTSPTAASKKLGLSVRTPLGTPKQQPQSSPPEQQQLQPPEQQQPPPPLPACAAQQQTPCLSTSAAPPEVLSTPVRTPALHRCDDAPCSTTTKEPLSSTRMPLFSPALPVSQRSLSGEALLVPFRRLDSYGSEPRGSDSSSNSSSTEWLDVARPIPGVTYQSLVAAGPLDKPTASQIEVDIVRTNLGDGDGVEAKREQLRRVLNAFSRHEPSIGYVQGMDAVAAAALDGGAEGHESSRSDSKDAECDGGRESSTDRHADDAVEERAFWWLTHVTSTLLRGFYSNGMPALWVELSVLRKALVALRPKLVAHLDRLGFDFGLLAPSWYLTLFQRILDTSEIAPSLAALSARKVEPTHIAIGIVLACEPALLAASDFDHAAKVLCGTVCASRSRRAPTGVLAHATKAISLMPSAKLAKWRAKESGGSLAGKALSIVGAEPETPRAIKRAKWGWW